MKPPFAWGARPTVTVDGVGQPAQWGTGTWAVPDAGGSTIGVYLFNRVWRFGAASVVVGPTAQVVEYRAGLLPFARGRLVVR